MGALSSLRCATLSLIATVASTGTQSRLRPIWSVISWPSSPSLTSPFATVELVRVPPDHPSSFPTCEQLWNLIPLEKHSILLQRVTPYFGKGLLKAPNSTCGFE